MYSEVMNERSAKGKLMDEDLTKVEVMNSIAPAGDRFQR
jgi:hypothetical protein